MNHGVFALAAGLLAVGLAGCSDKGGATAAASPSPTGGAAATTPAAAPTTPAQPSPAQPAGNRVTWRGAVIALPPGWHKGKADDDTLCLLPAGDTNQFTCQSNQIQDSVLLYASERKLGPGAGPDRSSLDGSDLHGPSGWLYRGGEDQCEEETHNTQVESGTKPVGGRDAFYGRWEVGCQRSGRNFTSQRWELPKSRLGIVAFSVSAETTTALRDMVTAIDLSGYQPTQPR